MPHEAIAGRSRRAGRVRRIVATMEVWPLRGSICAIKEGRPPSGEESAEGSQLAASPLIYAFRNLVI